MDRLELIHSSLRSEIDFDVFYQIYKMATKNNIHDFLLIDDRSIPTVY